MRTMGSQGCERLSLDEVIITDELLARPSRHPDQQSEGRALVELVRCLQDPQAPILQVLAEAALRLCRAGSAGVSILEAEDGREVLRWHGAAGLWAAHRDATIPREDSLCQVALARNRPVLMRHPERWLRQDMAGMPPPAEMLLVPFAADGASVGAVWVVAHVEERRFDTEDLRLLTHLGEVASVARQLALQRQQLHESLERERAGTLLLQSISSGIVLEDDASALYEQILDAALALMNADCASLQKIVADGSLDLLAWRGFHAESARYWQRITPASPTTCGDTLRDGARQILADVDACETLAGSPHLQEFRRSGIRGMQSTPLVTRDGRHVGVMSTHWRRPHAPSEHELRLFDVLARETADLLERAEANAALREDARRKDEFLAVLGHELRNPLAPLRTGIALLRSGRQPPEEVDRIHAMLNRQIVHLARLVDDLLDLSRITRGQIELRLAPLDLRGVVGASVELARPALDRGEHVLTLELDDPPLPLLGDHERLTQIVANLLTNAAKYTAPGGRITVSAHHEGADAVLRVTDNGFGIPAHALERVFDMFAQVPEHSAGRGSSGLGIGLALSRRLAALHGGTLEACSEGLGHGSEFCLRLPLAVQAPAAEVPAPAAAVPVPLRILIVDDNADAALSLRMVLEMDGHEVQLAHDGLQALDQFAAFEPQALLIDIGLPGMDGHEVARRIRAQDPERRLLLIAVTGWGQEEDRAKALAAGFDLHMAKPVQMDALLQALSRPHRPVA